MVRNYIIGLVCIALCLLLFGLLMNSYPDEGVGGCVANTIIGLGWVAMSSIITCVFCFGFMVLCKDFGIIKEV